MGKFLIFSTHLGRRGGTTLPGRISLKLAPKIIAGLAGQITRGNIAVTGTNGKTTTTALLAHIIRSAGYSVSTNDKGSNLSWGVATALIKDSRWIGKHNCYGVLEIDEGAFPGLTEQLQPIGGIVTNIFPDQLDRFGGIDRVQENINRGLAAMPENSFQVLNADDPYVASINSNRQTWSYGLELPLNREQPLGRQNGYTCPRCGQTLHYKQAFLAHLGHYTCTGCRFERLRPDVAVLDFRQTTGKSLTLSLSLRGRRAEMNCPLTGNYNVYNIAAAITGALAINIPESIISWALSSFSPPLERRQRIVSPDGKHPLIIILVKNAVGANQAITDILSAEEKFSLLVAINDRPADGIDVSWLWNVGFEQVARFAERLYAITASGERAWDLAVRLKYAGLDENRVSVEKDPERALKSTLEATPSGKTVYILSNYTALTALNPIIERFKQLG